MLSSNRLHSTQNIQDITLLMRQKIQEKLIELFDDKIVFSFIFGSFAKGYASYAHDFDVFVCLQERDLAAERSLTTFMIQQQLLYGLNPDYDYPIEIMSRTELEAALDKADTTPIGLMHNSHEAFDFTTWSQILSDKKIFILGDENYLNTLHDRCMRHENMWKKQLIDELAHQDLLFLLKRVARFDNKFSSEMKKKKLETSVSKLSVEKLDIAGVKQWALQDQVLTLKSILKVAKEHRLNSNIATISLDGADGAFEPYSIAATAYEQTQSDLRKYIPYNSQYTFEESDYDRRLTLLNFVKEKGIAPQSMLADVDNIVTGHGTGYILNQCLQMLNNNQGHQFIIPTPTYGFFIPAIEACGAKAIYLDLVHFDNFEITATELERVILKNNQELFKNNIGPFIQAFRLFVKNLRTKDILVQEINRIVVLSEHTKDSEIYESAKAFKQFIDDNLSSIQERYPEFSAEILNTFPELPQVKMLYFINPHNPLGKIYTQAHINALAAIAAKYHLTVIEDLTHMELILESAAEADIGFFNQANLPLNVISLISPSKALCIAECRVGFAFMSNKKLVNDYKEKSFNDGLFLSQKQLNALEKAFILSPMRKAYLTASNKEYSFRRDLVKFIVYGDEQSELGTEQKQQINNFFLETKLDVQAYAQGIEGLKLLNKHPQSGMFCVLDLSSLKNKFFVNTPITNNTDLGEFLRLYNLVTLTGDNLYYKRRLIIRLPFSEPPLLIIAALKRIQELMQAVSLQPIDRPTVAQQSLVLEAPEKNTLATFEDMQLTCNMLANHIKTHYQVILDVLTDYESHHVASDEIARAIDCLENIDKNSNYFISHTDQVASFLPLNLPLYSLILFGVMPGFMCNTVYLKAPMTSREIYIRVFDALKISEFLPHLQLTHTERELFVENYARVSDVIIFTGTYDNAVKILKKSKKDALFLFNGAGHNPLVITDSANLELAVRKSVEVKTYNNGQDCAGPDTILVHASVCDEFLNSLQKNLSKVKIGDYKHPENIIGKISEENHLLKIADFFFRHRANIVYGGTIDFKNKIVHPTIIVSDIHTATNFQELFAPVIFITKYSTDVELELYFGNNDYINNQMYVSVFGQSEYLQNHQGSIVLQDKIILDIENGNSEFGGYGARASFVVYQGKKTCKPILIPREMFEALSPKSRLSIAPETSFYKGKGNILTFSGNNNLQAQRNESMSSSITLENK